MRKRTTDDKDRRKARELLEARERIARRESKGDSIKEKIKTEENQKQAKITTTINSLVLQCVTSSQLQT